MSLQSNSPPAPFRGTERFAVEREIGRGGMGVVYRARDRDRGAVVALKTLARADPAGLYRFKREFRTLADTIHPNLVALHELVAEDDQWFFTMELIDGVDFLSHVRGLLPSAEQDALPTATGVGPISETLDTRDTPGGAAGGSSGAVRAAPPVDDFARLRDALRQLVTGVCALHEAGHLHRDIKPSNVMVAREDGRVVLLDFGVITELAQRPAVGDELVGTPAYMAPEQSDGGGATRASDWYSVGVMLFEALTGRRPFYGRSADILAAKRERDPPDPVALCPNTDPALAALCRDLLAGDPAERPSGDSLRERLEMDDSSPPGAVEATTPLPAGHLLVGRERHLAALQVALERVRGGLATTVFVHGASGMGKSWLVRRFLDQLGDEVLVLQGRCYERESVPYKALDNLIDDLCRHLIGLDSATAAALLPVDIDALATAFPVLRRVEAVMAHRGRAAGGDPLELRGRAFAALRQLLAALAARQPLIIFVDDLQWGDIDSAPLLTGLMQPPDPPPLLLLCSYRSEETVGSALLDRLREGAGEIEATDLEVAPLEPAEARRLARHLLVQVGLTGPGTAVFIAHESGGCPFFVHELVRHTQLRVAGDELDQQEVRLSLDEVIRSRVAGLPDDARRLLEVVAVAGRPLSQEVVDRAADVGAARRPVINQLRVANLVHTTGSRSEDLVEVYHDRIREAVVAGLPADRLAARHRRLALALQSSGSTDSEALALHFAAAGEHERASEYASQAAARASAALAFERAAELYRFALAHHRLDPAGERALRTQLARALGNAGRGAEAAQEYLALTVGATAAEALDHRRNAAMYYLAGGHIDEGMATMRGVLSAVGIGLKNGGRRARLVSMLMQRLRLRLRGLDFEPRDVSQVAATELCTVDACWATALGLSMVDTILGASFTHRHTRMALALGEPTRVVRGLTAEIAIRAAMGPKTRPQVERFITRARALVEQIEEREIEAWFLASIGFADYQIGRFRSAGDLCRQAAEIFRNECRDVFWVMITTQTHRSWAMYYLGELRELAEHVRYRLAEARQRGDLYTAANLRVGLPNIVWLCADDPDAARRHAEEALASWTREGFHLQHYWSLYALAQCDLYVGDGAAALKRVEETWPALRRSLLLHLHLIRLEALHLRGRALIGAASGADAARQLRQALRIARRIEREKVGYGDGFAALLRAGVATGRGDSEAAVVALAVAEQRFQAADMALFAAVARRRRGELRGGEEGEAEVAEADRWLVGQGVVAPARIAAAMVPLAAPPAAD